MKRLEFISRRWFEFISVMILILLLSCSVHAGSTSYIYANGQRVAKINETGTYYYHSDHLGSTSAVTDSDGEVVEEQVNLPFGQLLTGEEKYGFTGKEHDETGLQYFGARYYDPNSGRFMNSDPAMDGVNWYRYVMNNPLRYIDPTGKWTEVSGYIDWGGPRKGDDFERLMTKIEEKTGIRSGINDVFGLSLLYPERIDETIGSPTARELVLDAYLGEEPIVLKKSRWATYAGEVDNHYEIGIKTSRYKNIETFGIDPRTYDESTSFLHELSHILRGTDDPKIKKENGKETDYHNGLGTAVEFTNKIRAELGLPPRIDYDSYISKDRLLWLRFDGGDISLGSVYDFPVSLQFRMLSSDAFIIEPKIKQKDIPFQLNVALYWGEFKNGKQD